LPEAPVPLPARLALAALVTALWTTAACGGDVIVDGSSTGSGTDTTSMGCCVQAFQPCTADAQCCAGTCNSGTCAGNSNAVCDHVPLTCTSNSECCSGNCSGGSCVGVAPSCMDDGTPCAADGECCSQACGCDGTCSSGL
jgi:hypothetical protein